MEPPDTTIVPAPAGGGLEPVVAESPSGGSTVGSVLRHRQFFWFTIGQSISLFGDKLHYMALIGLIGATRPASSGLVLAQFAILYCLPFLFIAPIAGVLVDRWNRKWTLIACDASRAVLVVIIPFAYASTGSVVPLLGLVAGVFVLTLFFNVAKMAIIPDLVAAHELLSANAVSNLLGRVATLLGIVLGGVIVGWQFWRTLGWTGYAAGFYVDALTFSISVATLLVLTSRSPIRRVQDRRATDARRLRAPEITAAVWRDFREVADIARRDGRVLFVLASTGLLGVVGGCMYVIVVVVMQTRTAWGTPGVGFVLGIMACGIVAGSALIGQRGHGWNKQRMIVAGYCAMAGLLVASARPFTFALHGPLSFAGGLALAPIMIAQDTLLHEQLAEDVRGRVFSARDMILNVTFGLAAATTGVAVTLLSRLGVEDPFRATLLVLGPLVLLAASGGGLWVRRGAP